MLIKLRKGNKNQKINYLFLLKLLYSVICSYIHASNFKLHQNRLQTYIYKLTNF